MTCNFLYPKMIMSAMSYLDGPNWSGTRYQAVKSILLRRMPNAVRSSGKLDVGDHRAFSKSNLEVTKNTDT